MLEGSSCCAGCTGLTGLGPRARSPHDLAHPSYRFHKPSAFNHSQLDCLAITFGGASQGCHLQPALERGERLAKIMQKLSHLLKALIARC